jgi:ABC-type transport system involved in cytochrome bd biosynthesis fused ATPase/permease subunit
MNPRTAITGFAEFKRLKSISVWILGVKHRRIIVINASLRSLLSLLDLLFMYLIAIYITILREGLLQNNLLNIFKLDASNSNLLLYLIVFVLLLKNLGSMVLQRFYLRSLADREAEVGTFIAKTAVFESDDYSRKSNTSELLQTLSNVISSLFSNLFKSIATFIGDLTTLLAILIGLFLFDWKLAAILFAYFGLFGSLLSRTIGKGLETNSKESQSLGRVLTQMYTETIALKTELKLSQKDSDFIRKIHDQRQKLTLLQSKNGFLVFFPRHMLEISLVLGILIAVVYLQIFQKNETVLTVIALIVAAGFRVLPSLNSVITNMGNFRTAIPALNRIDMLGQRFGIRDVDLAYSSTKSNLRITPFNGDLIFEAVTYGFPGEQNHIFENFDLVLIHNKTLLVKGVSGSGKTTLISLATGILSPTSGKIVIRYKGLEIPVNHLVSGMSFMKQSVPLLDDSIGFNIAMRDINESDNLQLVEIAEKIGLLQRILNAPESFNAGIGENGVLLSAGERQRLGLARCLFNKPSFLVLDEPTANLDYESEELIWKLLAELKGAMSILIVSHKDVPLEVFDDVLVLGTSGESND